LSILERRDSVPNGESKNRLDKKTDTRYDRHTFHQHQHWTPTSEYPFIVKHPCLTVCVQNLLIKVSMESSRHHRTLTTTYNHHLVCVAVEERKRREKVEVEIECASEYKINNAAVFELCGKLRDAALSTERFQLVALSHNCHMSWLIVSFRPESFHDSSLSVFLISFLKFLPPLPLAPAFFPVTSFTPIASTHGFSTTRVPFTGASDVDINKDYRRCLAGKGE
jgi:hypothetical protein